jgi:hypothetical protein
LHPRPWKERGRCNWVPGAAGGGSGQNLASRRRGWPGKGRGGDHELTTRRFEAGNRAGMASASSLGGTGGGGHGGARSGEVVAPWRRGASWRALSGTRRGGVCLSWAMRPVGPWVRRGVLHWRRRTARVGSAGRSVAGQGEVEEAQMRVEKACLHLCRRRASGGNGRTGGHPGAVDHDTEREDFDAPRCGCDLGRRGASG